MSTRIEDYAIIGDTKTVAAVARTGSIDWWCVPRIDSGAVFAALLGEPKHGRWCVAPKGDVTAIRRSYASDSLVLETEFDTGDGTVKVSDFMSPGVDRPTIFRIVDGLSGSVTMSLELITRFDYGSIVPWAQSTGDGLTLVAGNDALRLHSPVPLRPQPHDHHGRLHRASGSTARLLTRLVLGPRRSAGTPGRVGRAALDRAVLGPSGGPLHL